MKPRPNLEREAELLWLIVVASCASAVIGYAIAKWLG